MKIKKIKSSESSRFLVINSQIEGINPIYLDQSVIKILRNDGKLEEEIKLSSLEALEIEFLEREEMLEKDIYELDGIGNFHFKINQEYKTWEILELSCSMIETEDDNYYAVYYHKTGFFKSDDSESNTITCFYSSEYDKLKDIIKDVYENLIEAQYYINVANKLMTEKYKASTKLHFDNADAFWSMTVTGFRKLGILLLATVYDDDKNSVSLKKILNIIYSRNWKKLSPNFLELSQNELNRDKEYLCKNKNQLLPTLFNQRNKELAHHDQKELFKFEKAGKIKRRNDININLPGYQSEKLPQEMQRLSTQELNQLIDKGIEICRRYSQIINYDLPNYDIPEDYHNLLN